jgi:hypothetical protein
VAPSRRPPGGEAPCSRRRRSFIRLATSSPTEQGGSARTACTPPRCTDCTNTVKCHDLLVVRLRSRRLHGYATWQRFCGRWTQETGRGRAMEQRRCEE